LFCHDAKLAVAFTGLATFGTFDTATWLAETLFEIAETRVDIASLLEELRIRADATFSNLHVDDRRLSIIFSGFVYWAERPEPRVYVLSNFEHGQSDAQTFSLRTVSAKDSVIVEIAGRSAAIPPGTLALLRSLMQRSIPTPSIVRFAVKHLQRAAKDIRSLKLIGEHCNSAVIFSAPDTVVTSTYHSTKNMHCAYGANVVIAQTLISLGYEISGPNILAGPEIRKRDPCWCGSGDLFKHCHRKKFGSVYVHHSAFKRPLSAMVRSIPKLRARSAGSSV
jgi:hypothetical protein